MPRDLHLMSVSEQEAAREAIACCSKLSTFLAPMLLDARVTGDTSGVSFIAGFMADLGAVREALKDMLDESKKAAVKGGRVNGVRAKAF